MSSVDSGVSASVVQLNAVRDYKGILKAVLEQRPSGTRQRLADEMGKNRSFISQITNPEYRTPIPSNHLEIIFEVCHFSEADRAAFLAAYQAAHPGRRVLREKAPAMRTVSIDIPDLEDSGSNQELEKMIREFATTAARLLSKAK